MRHLIKKILKEEVSEFQNIYNTMWDKMLRQVCMRYTNDINKAEDYCQNGFIKVYKNLPKYKGKGSLEGFVRRIINNSILDEIRKRKVEFSDQEPDWGRVNMKADEPYEEEGGYTMEMVDAVLPMLSPSYRTAFELYYKMGYKHHQIADKLKISVGTSKSNLAKAKKKIKQLIDKEFNV